MKNVLFMILSVMPMLLVGCSSDGEYLMENDFTLENQQKHTTTFFVEVEEGMQTNLEHKFVCIDTADELESLNLQENVKAEILSSCGKTFDWQSKSLVITRFTNPFATETNVDVYNKDSKYRFAVTFVGDIRTQAFWHTLLIGIVDAKGLKPENMSATLDDSKDENFKKVAW